LNLKRFFVFSAAFHISLIVAALWLLSLPSQNNIKPRDEFSARLVSPDEFLSQKPTLPHAPRILPSPPAMTAPVPVPMPKPPIQQKGHTGIEKETVKEQTDKKAEMQYPSAASQAQKPAVPENRSERQSLPPVPPVSSHAGQSKEETSPPVIHEDQREAHRETAELSGSKGNNKKAPDHLQPSFREKIFDKSVIGDLAKRGSEKEEKENKGKDKAFSFDTDEFKFLIYNRRLKERIENIWVYPPEAAAKGIYGDLIIRFTIKKNGQLGSVELVRTSGHKSLDDAAMKALKDGAPYWPLPKEWNLEGYTIEGHFIYTIYGYYIR
jgi:periplasmic protein TonB